MFFRLLLPWLLFFSIAGNAQQKTIDSLLGKLKSYQTEDTTRLSLLNELVYTYAVTDIEKGLIMADSAVRLGLKLQSVNQLGIAYRNKAEILYYNTDYTGSARESALALSCFERTNNFEQQAGCHFMLGYTFFSLGEYKKATIHHEKAALLYKKTGNVKKEAGAFNSIGANYSQLSDFPKAIENYYKSLGLYEKLKDSAGMALAIASVGYANKQMGNYDKALGFYEQALSIYRLTGDEKYEADILMKIGTVYDSKKDGVKALSFYSLAYNLNKTGSFTKGLVETTGNIGITYAALKQYDSAFHYLKEARGLLEEIGDQRNKAVIYNMLGEVIFKASDTVLRKHGINPAVKYDSAEKFLSKGLRIAKEHELVQQQLESVQVLSELYAATGRYREAFEAGGQAMLLKDSIFSNEKRDEITKKEMQFEFDKQQAVLNATHRAELKQQKTVRNFLLGGTGLVLLTSGLLFWSYKRRRDAKVRQQEAELKAEITDTEMKALRAQMNPHFIFNSLNSISDYITKNKTELADEYLTKFARLMRLVLENSDKKEVSLSEDLAALELYMQLESLRLKNKFIYEIKVDSGINKEETLIPPLILQPFVENSIWHGLAKKEGEGHILICIEKKEGMLSCSVEDNGIGRGASKENIAYDKTGHGKKSLGMRITRERISIINKTKKADASLSLTDLQQGTRVEVILPYESMF